MPARPAADAPVTAPSPWVAVDATPLLGRPTGVGVFCAGLLGALAGRPEVTVSAFAVSWRRRRRIDGLLPAGVPAHQRPMPARPLYALWGRSDVPPIDWFVGPADVVHGTNFVVPPSRAASVVTVHDLTVVRYPELCDQATLAYPGLVRRALRRGAWVHTPSAYVAGEVVELLGADPERVRAVHSGTPPAPACPGGHRSPPPGLLPQGTARFILSVGTAEPRKDLPGLVRAFDLVAADRPDLALVLVGPPGWGADQLDAAVSGSRFVARIVRLGWLSAPTLDAVRRSAALLAFPSVYEGFGFPPLEAMAAGVPVVATRAGALPEVLGEAAELVPAGDREALAGAMAAVLDSPERRASLVARGTARAATYTWASCAAGMVALYNDAVRSHGR